MLMFIIWLAFWFVVFCACVVLILRFWPLALALVIAIALIKGASHGRSLDKTTHHRSVELTHRTSRYVRTL